MLGARLKTTPPSPSVPRFWQENAPLQSSAVAFVFQLVRYSVNLGVTMALARLIVPGDFGLFAMAAAFTGFLLLFKDGGVEPALLSEKTIRDDELAALTSLSALQGSLLAAGCALLGPVLARLYGEPRLNTALLLSALAFLFHGFDVLPNALLLRAHRFRIHALIDTLSLVLGLGVTLGLALGGAGYWALFATEPAMAAGLLTGHALAVRWRPRFGAAWSLARRFVRYGRDMSVVRAFGYGSRNADNLILGLAAGPVSLAFYNKAFRLISLPQESVSMPLGRLAVPLLSRAYEHPPEFVRAFRHFTLTSLAIGLPAVAFLLVSAPEIVAVVYGAQWDPVVPLLRLLGVMGLVNSFVHVYAWVYVAAGTVPRLVRWEAVNLVVLAGAFLAGARWGAPGVAVAASAGWAVLRIPALLYCFKGTPLRLRDIGGVLWRPLLAALLGAGLVLLVRRGAGAPAAALATVARDGIVLAAGYALGWMLVPGWRAFLRHELRRPDPVP